MSLGITVAKINRFSKFFHCGILIDISNVSHTLRNTKDRK